MYRRREGRRGAQLRSVRQQQTVLCAKVTIKQRRRDRLVKREIHCGNNCEAARVKNASTPSCYAQDQQGSSVPLALAPFRILGPSVLLVTSGCATAVLAGWVWDKSISISTSSRAVAVVDRQMRHDLTTTRSTHAELHPEASCADFRYLPRTPQSCCTPPRAAARPTADRSV